MPTATDDWEEVAAPAANSGDWETVQQPQNSDWEPVTATAPKTSQDDLRAQLAASKKVKPATTLGELPSVMFTPSDATAARAAQQVATHTPEQVDALGADAGPIIPPTTPQDIATLTGGDAASRTSRGLAATVTTPGQIANSFATPEGALMFASPAAGAAFVAQMATSVPAQLGRAAGAYSAGDNATGDENLIQGLTTAGMLALPAIHALKSGKSLDDVLGQDKANQLRQNVKQVAPPNETALPVQPGETAAAAPASPTAAAVEPPPAAPTDTGVSEPAGETAAPSGEDIGKAIGAKFDGEFDLGRGATKQFTFAGDNFEGDQNTPHYGTTFQMPADATLEDAHAKAQDVKDRFSDQGDYSIENKDGKFNILNPKGGVEETFDNANDAVSALKDYNTPSPEVRAPIPSKVDASSKIQPEDLQPGLIVDGKVHTGGDTHGEVFRNLPDDLKTGAGLDAFNRGDSHVFVDKTGKVYTRQEAADALGLKEPLESNALNSLKKSPTATGVESTKNAPGPALGEPKAPVQSQKFRVGNSPQLHSLVEKLPASPVEIANGEQPVRVRNDKTGEEQIVDSNKDLTPVTERPAADKAAQANKSKALDAELKSLKLDPSVFRNAEQKRAAIKRAKALVNGEGPGAASAAPEGSAEFGKPGTFSRDVTGLAARVRAQREAAGMTDATQPGAGIAPEASVERGKQLLASGVDPEKILQDFERTKRFSSDDVAVVRAHQDRLARDTNAAEEKFGTDSPEYHEAEDRESSWASRTKAIQTEWAKSGHAQQGEVDIDTGTFSGIKRAYRDAHDGEELPKKDEKKAQDFADESKKVAGEQSDLLKKISDKIETETAPKTSAAEKSASDAEKRAIAAAHKTIREAADRLAKAESKTRVAKTVGERDTAKIQEDAARKALEAANKTIREAAARAAELENKKRIAEAAQKQVAGTLPHTRTEFFRYKGGKMDLDQVRALWNYAKKNYIDKGNSNFSDIVHKVSTDLGLKFNDVANGLAQPKGIRKLTDALWRKQTDARRVSESAKRWVRQTNSPLLGQVVPRAARLMFGAKVFGHGGVAFGTHAPMVAFMPKYWNAYARDFGKMYKMVFSTAEYEKNVQALRADPNFNTAGRAGLVNDPYKVEDFNNPDMAQYFGKLSGAGNRGYFALKVLRQDMFNQGWNRLPESIKTPEMAKAMADDINHITGVVKSSVGGNKTSLAFFAPRLLASRAAFLVGDPYRAVEAASAAMTPARWKALPPEAKFQIINQVKQKATIVATAYGLLLANQAILAAVGSRQKVNLNDPTKSDFWKFKVAGMDFSYGNAMLNMARLPIRLWRIGAGDGGKLKHVIYPDESMYSAAGEFARSQASPLAGLGLDFVFKGDYQNRPLPQIPGYGKPIPVPKRLAAQGIKPYTWTEFFAEQAAPIPLEEALREVWRTGLGASPAQLKQFAKASGTTIIMAATGGRLTEDIQPK
jgi:hypothetical protein